jgi:hypothetical protein
MAGHMKKKRCNHIRDDYMPVPEGYSKKDFQKQQRGGLDTFTQTRIKDFISYFCATNIPDNEALFLIQKQFGKKLSTTTYHNLKNEVMSNVEVQVWVNSYAKIGFVAAHIGDIERTKMMADRIVAAFMTEMAKEHEERNYQMISQLTRDYEKLTKLAVVLRAGAPILARIKAMIDASNIRALENDPTMSDEEKKRILSRKGNKAITAVTVPNTLTDDPTDVTIVSRYVDNNRVLEKEEKGRAVQYKDRDIQPLKPRKSISDKEIDSSLESEQPDSSSVEEETEDIPGQSESGSEFIQFLMEESKSDDIIPKRYKSCITGDSEG